MSVPSVAELIRDHGHPLTKPCSLCNRSALFLIGSVETGFLACLACDTNTESRKAARIKGVA